MLVSVTFEAFLFIKFWPLVFEIYHFCGLSNTFYLEFVGFLVAGFYKIDIFVNGVESLSLSQFAFNHGKSSNAWEKTVLTCRVEQFNTFELFYFNKSRKESEYSIVFVLAYTVVTTEMQLFHFFSN